MLDFTDNEDHADSMNVELTTEQKIALEELQRQSRDHHVCDRVRCVLLSSEGWSTVMIAQSQRIHETTVRRHLNDWLNEQKLVPENGGSQRSPTVASNPANRISYPAAVAGRLPKYPYQSAKLV